MVHPRIGADVLNWSGVNTTSKSSDIFSCAGYVQLLDECCVLIAFLNSDGTKSLSFLMDTMFL